MINHNQENEGIIIIFWWISGESFVKINLNLE